MIIKSKTRKSNSFRQLLNYMILGEERVPESRIILHNVLGENIEAWVNEFQTNEQHRLRRRKNSVKLYHEILAWHPEDTPYLTLEIIEDLVREYIRQRNPNGLYVGAIHLAQDHYHVHLCISGVEYGSGKALRISKQDFRKMKERVQMLEQSWYPELHYSQVEHGKAIPTPSALKPPKHAKIKALITEISRASHSAKEFLDQFKQNKLEIYYRRGKATGIRYGDKRYRLKTLGLPPEKVAYLERLRGLEREK